ncbi:MAG: hypothetical protein IK026_00710 [Eubacteriaceae bacterium]|nr:hypothetical protein [Eubacteriaceae bacterium]
MSGLLLKEIGKNDIIVSNKYDRAMALIDSGDYEEAFVLLKGLDYRDSADKLESIKTQYEISKLSKAQVGDYVIFGSYEQNNNTSDGKEEIEWLVLAREGDRVLLISRYALDYQSYNSWKSVTWEKCSLRKWLNGTFINNAFSTNEQAIIQRTTVTADKNPQYNTSPGNSTTDKVFLLSIKEANKYFSSDKARQCEPTAYCKSAGAFKDYQFNCNWWLRSPGDGSENAAIVQDDGSIKYDGIIVENVNLNFGYLVTVTTGTVRPALWVNLEQ